MRHLIAPLLTILVTVLVAAPGAALAPATDATTPAPAMPTAAPAAAGPPQDEPLVPGTTPTVVATDATGDVSGLFGTPDPTGEIDAYIDIVDVGIAETEDSFVYHVKHRGYPDLTRTLSTVPLGSSLYCSLMWDLNDGEEFRYGAYTYLSWDGSLEEMVFYAYAFMDEAEDEDDWDREYLSDVEVALVGGDHIEILVPKGLYEGESGRDFRAGDVLDGLETSCSGSSGIFVGGYDWIDPTETPITPFPVRLTPSTEKLAIQLANTEGDQPYALAAGAVTKASLLIENLASNKLLVNITAEVVDDAGSPLPGWSVQAAPTFEVSSGRTVPASLIITSPADAAHRSGGTLKVRAVALGHDGVARLSQDVIAIRGPSADENVLYFHNWDGDHGYCYGICGGPEGGTDQILDEDAELFQFNVLEEDPVYDREAQDSGPVALFSSSWGYAQLDAPLPKEIRFDGDGVVEFALGVRADVPRDIRFEAYFYGGEEGELIATFDQRIPLTSDFQTHVLKAPVREDDLRMSAGSRMAFEFRQSDATLPFSFFVNEANTVEFDPGAMRLTLPLKETVSTEVEITDGRFLPSIALGNDTDPEEYLNPGKSQAFDLELLNEGTVEDVVSLDAEVSDPAWSVRFDPGRSFKLEPGRTAPLCVSVTAPPDAAPNSIIEVNLTATSKSDAEVKTATTLKLIVTNGVPIEDDVCVEIEEDRFVKPLSEAEESPAGSLVTLLLGAVALLGVLRRRR